HQGKYFPVWPQACELKHKPHFPQEVLMRYSADSIENIVARQVEKSKLRFPLAESHRRSNSFRG
ncbi:MAG: hypothetical protein IJZ18_03925, partial [Mailhella sp.]|nr:hypothetical protein [Mailhella sp.]